MAVRLHFAARRLPTSLSVRWIPRVRSSSCEPSPPPGCKKRILLSFGTASCVSFPSACVSFFVWINVFDERLGLPPLMRKRNSARDRATHQRQTATIHGTSPVSNGHGEGNRRVAYSVVAYLSIRQKRDDCCMRANTYCILKL